jgi:hypothetical protein
VVDYHGLADRHLFASTFADAAAAVRRYVGRTEKFVEMTNVREVIEHGLHHIDAARRVDLPLRDALRVHSLIGELVAFFHSRRSQLETEQFIGTRDSGALAALFDAYYGYLRDVWPPDVLEAMEAGAFDAGAVYSIPGAESAESVSVSNGEVFAWIDGGIHLKARTSSGDPVELSETEARAVADRLNALADQL